MRTLSSRASAIWSRSVIPGTTSNVHRIRIGSRTNIQDGTIVHVTRETGPTTIGNGVTIGHAAVIHACTLKDHAFVGMGATVLDGAMIGEGGMLAAGGLLAPGKVIGPNELWGGSPARLWRVMSPEERASFHGNAAHYVRVAARFLDRMKSQSLIGLLVLAVFSSGARAQVPAASAPAAPNVAQL